MIFLKNLFKTLIVGTNAAVLTSTVYPQSMFWSKNKKNRYTPANPSFSHKVGFKGVYIPRTCFSDDF